MARILIQKAERLVYLVMLASGAQVLACRHLNYVQMELTVTQLVLSIVLCVLKVIGEILFIFLALAPRVVSLI